MNDFSTKVVHYLSAPDASAERKQALRDLISHGLCAFDTTEERAKKVVENYLDQNPLNFCQDGIDRFREAMDLNDQGLGTVRVVLDLEVLSDDRKRHDFGESPSQDNCLSYHLAKDLEDSKVGGRFQVGRARWLDYAASRRSYDLVDLGITVGYLAESLGGTSVD